MNINKAHILKKRIIEITEKDLPVYCPIDDKNIWQFHPKIYLNCNDKKNNKIRCPYCNTEFRIISK